MNRTIPIPFQLNVSDDILFDLRARLARVRWPDEPPGEPWAYGISLRYMRELVRYWRERFDWRIQEGKLNSFRQFTVPLAGIQLHYIHEEGKGPKPRLLSHGWPGSVLEFYKIIPMLTDPSRFGDDPANAFTVVAPSLPGYALSFQPNQPRFSIEQVADCFALLMAEVLGFSASPPREEIGGPLWPRV
jgi:hypothetical protein